MHQNISLGSNGVDRVRSLRKIPTRLRGTKFCTSSARFAPRFITQANSPKCTQIVRNAPKHQFRVQWGGYGAFVAKNSNATSCQIVRNAKKHQFRVQWGGSGAFVAKNSNATSCQIVRNAKKTSV